MNSKTGSGAEKAGRSPSQGFTLVELLVVMGIIAVLAGILLPVLARAKSSARRVECLTRMKQWTLAFQTYADQNEGMMPREGYETSGQVYWNTWADVQDEQSRDVWYNALAGHVGVRPASAYAEPFERSPFYERGSFFHCPSARIPKAADKNEIAFFSIAMNSQLIEDVNAPAVAFARILRPSNTVLFLDNLLEDERRVVREQAWDNLGQPAATANRFAGVRHGRGGNLVFADGHVEWVSGTKVVETDGLNRGWIRFPEIEIVWHVEEP